jgi:carboxypeptidase family protein
MMRTYSFVAVVCLGGVALAQQPRDAARAATGTAVLSGTVVADEAGGRPIRRAIVNLNQSSSDLRLSRMTVTDDAGRFVFRQLPAGNMSLSVSKPGYITSSFGAKRAGGTGVPIALADGQRVDNIAIKLSRGSVITGTIVDQTGKPMPSTSIRLMQSRLVNGERVLTPSYGSGGSLMTTDDRGTYRIWGLLPGEYAVAATPTRTAPGGEVRLLTAAEWQWAERYGPGGAPDAPSPPVLGPTVAYAAVYYPGTTDPTAAGLVTVAAGQERAGIDFAVQLVNTARIEGVVLDADGRPASGVQVSVLPRGSGSDALTEMIMIDTLFMSMSLSGNRSGADGKFALQGIPPGDYVLSARVVPAAGRGRAGGGGAGTAPAAGQWASADVSVNGRDLTDVRLTLAEGMRVTGRIGFDATTLQPPQDFSRMQVRLIPAQTSAISIISSMSNVVAPDGTFTITGVTPGQYRIGASAGLASSSGPSWGMRSAMLNGRDAADVLFDVKPGQDISGVIVTFTDTTSEILGTLFDAAGRPTSDLSIIVFGADRATWFQGSRRLRPPVRPASDGKFRVTVSAAGEYYLAALTDYEPNDWYNPQFLEQVAASAMKVTVGPGEKKTQDLKIAGG